MAFSNVNQGVLFNNQDRKEKENDRDYGGTINIICPHCDAGSDHWLSGWLQTAKRTGAKFLSLRAKPKEGQTAVVAQSTSGNGAHDRDAEFNDEIPF